ncbi:MAG: hypothetical protein ACOYM4_15790 [Nodosilinea sp.]|jgi:hypothetical protein
MAIIKAGKLTGSAKEQQLLGIKSKDKAAVPEYAHLSTVQLRSPKTAEQWLLSLERLI